MVSNGTPQNEARDVVDEAGHRSAQVAGDAADRAKDVAATTRVEAANVKDSAVSAGSDVVSSAQDQTAAVIGEARDRGQQLLSEATTELRNQAATGQSKAAELLRSLSDELDEMVSKSDQNGPATQLVSTAKDFGRRTSDWLDRTDPDGIVDDVRRYAARKPWTFMAIAAGVGFVGARIARGLQDANEPAMSQGRRYETPSVPSTYYSDDTYRRPYTSNDELANEIVADEGPYAEER